MTENETYPPSFVNRAKFTLPARLGANVQSFPPPSPTYYFVKDDSVLALNGFETMPSIISFR